MRLSRYARTYKILCTATALVSDSVDEEERSLSLSFLALAVVGVGDRLTEPVQEVAGDSCFVEALGNVTEEFAVAATVGLVYFSVSA